MATITSTSTTITVSGDYKAFTGGTSTSTVIQRASGDSPASGDAGRFLLWKNGSNTGDWEVRYIASATSSSVTVTDGGFSSAPPSGATFAISTNLDDMNSALADSVMRKNGLSYQMMDRDFSLTSGAFLADEGKSLSAKGTSPSSFAGTFGCDNNCVMQWGRLIGGEANGSTETVGGCHLNLELVNNNSLMFTTQGVFNTAGPVFNFYGCQVTSTTSGPLPFIRAPGPMRIIGCVFDGPMGGRLYSPASELVDTRFSGNTSGGVAWSLGGSFVRPIDNTFFFQNNTAIKAFQGWQGTFSNTTFADSNAKIIDSGNATSSLQFDFIDCTTFPNSAITANKGNYEQLKSINYTMADSNGVGLDGVNVAVYDNVDLVQGGGVQTSTAGAVPTINARFFRKNHGQAGVNKFPFTIRARKYGYNYVGISSEVAEPIKQETRLTINEQLVSTEAQAAAITGIALDFVNETVVITEDHSTQSLYDYYQYQLAQVAQMPYAEDWVRAGDETDIDDWDMTVDGAVYTGRLVTSGTISVINGGSITGIYTDQNGTVLPPQPYSVTNIAPGSRLRVYNTTTGVEIYNDIVTGTSYSGTYTEGGATAFSDGDIITVTLAKFDKLDFIAVVGDTGVGWSVIADQKEDSVYNSLFIDGSTITKFQANYVNPDIDLLVAQDFTIAEFYAWYKYNLNDSADAMRVLFGALRAEDEANFRILTSIADLYLDNNVSVSVKQTDNRRIYRDSGDGYPVKTPTTSGYGIDVTWQSKVFVAGVQGLTPEEKDQLAKAATNSGLIPALL